MTIQCDSHEDLMRTIASLVERGIQFDADTADMRITLTGGF